MGKQSLDQFIAQLMNNDESLKKFLADPTNGGEEHGITKAERAVLRRTIAHLSNKSKNGYSVQRDYGSYRRSLRLLQNVLHQHSSNHAIGQMALSDVAETAVSFHVYFTGNPSEPGAPYTNPALAYTNYVTFTGMSNDGTLGSAMSFPNPPPSGNAYTSTPVGVTDQNHNPKKLSYTAIKQDGEWYIETFILTDNDGVSNRQVYNLPFNATTEHEPFWYYSLNGQAIEPNAYGYYTKNPNATQGGEAVSFALTQLNGATSVYWQAIAPDSAYGFSPCFQHPDTSYIVLGLPVPNKPVIYTGNIFYENTVANVYIDPSVSSWILSSSINGTGNLVTDDVMELRIMNSNGSSSVLYSHDYSNGCSGYINPTGPVDLASQLQQYSGKYITLMLICKDKCGGVERSSGYILVPDPS